MKLYLFTLLALVVFAISAEAAATPRANNADVASTASASTDSKNNAASAQKNVSAGNKNNNAASAQQNNNNKAAAAQNNVASNSQDNTAASAAAGNQDNVASAATATNAASNNANVASAKNVGNNKNNLGNKNAINKNKFGNLRNGIDNPSATLSAASATRTRPCDQGDISLAAGLTALVQIGLGEQAAVVTLQGLLDTGSQSDISDAITRLGQFVNTAALQLQTCQEIADDNSFAQKQLGLLANTQAGQSKLVTNLSGSAQDNSTLNALLESFLADTDNAQDGANNALIDCFLPLTVVSG